MKTVTLAIENDDFADVLLQMLEQMQFVKVLVEYKTEEQPKNKWEDFSFPTYKCNGKIKDFTREDVYEVRL